MVPVSLPVRIAMTWLAIFPLVALVRWLIAPLITGWPDLLQTALVMTVVVPIAVTWVMPAFTRLVLKMQGRRAARKAQ